VAASQGIIRGRFERPNFLGQTGATALIANSSPPLIRQLEQIATQQVSLRLTKGDLKSANSRQQHGHINLASVIVPTATKRRQLLACQALQSDELTQMLDRLFTALKAPLISSRAWQRENHGRVG
jgi:hypothetical protein